MFMIQGDRIRNGFSLLELLLVIFIISLVYFLGFEGVEKSEQTPDTLSPLTLKKSILQNPKYPGKGTLICTNGCRSCYFSQDIASPFKAYEGRTDLPNLEVYTIDASDNLQKITYGRYQDRQICLRIDFYPNGSSTPLILQTDEATYFLPSYFGESVKTDSLEKAQELWLAYDHSLDGQGDFY